jgi:hypothetical protein
MNRIFLTLSSCQTYRAPAHCEHPAGSESGARFARAGSLFQSPRCLMIGVWRRFGPSPGTLYLTADANHEPTVFSDRSHLNSPTSQIAA